MTTRPAPIRRALRAVEAFLWLAGVLALGTCAAALAEERFYQDAQARALERVRSKPRRGPETAVARDPGRTAGGLDPAFVARLEIPRLRLAAFVREGDGPRTLRIAVGHVPGTALPGQPGNVCLAAHRDGFFRGLASLRPGDSVRLVTRTATYAYHVDDARIVDPDETGLLAPTAMPTLTLVTCYPFAWIGPAPRRYVVTARLEKRSLRSSPS